jgi:hypothetical protein
MRSKDKMVEREARRGEAMKKKRKVTDAWRARASVHC